MHHRDRLWFISDVVFGRRQLLWMTSFHKSSDIPFRKQPIKKMHRTRLCISKEFVTRRYRDTPDVSCYRDNRAFDIRWYHRHTTRSYVRRSIRVYTPTFQTIDIVVNDQGSWVSRRLEETFANIEIDRSPWPRFDSKYDSRRKSEDNTITRR